MTADPPNAVPATIDVERDVALTVGWEDGHLSRFPLRPLRLACPCAGCKAERAAGRELRLPTALAITDVVLAGAWGITPTWNDGHGSGIYSWSNLRAACGCEICAPA